MPEPSVPPAVVRATTLETITNILALVNVLTPSIVAIVAALRNSADSLEKLLADADTIEQSEIEKLKKQLGLT